MEREKNIKERKDRTRIEGNKIKGKRQMKCAGK